MNWVLISQLAYKSQRLYSSDISENLILDRLNRLTEYGTLVQKLGFKLLNRNINSNLELAIFNTFYSLYIMEYQQIKQKSIDLL